MAETPQPAQGTATAEREELHFRRIDMRGWKRSDGLFEVEARLTDRKPCDFVPASGGKYVAAGDPIHDMGVRLVFNLELYVLEVSTFTDAAPYAVCPEAGPTLQTVVGLRMVSGWGQEVRKRLGGAQSCTHLMELLMPMATVAYQSMSSEQAGRPEPVDSTGRPRKIDSCFAYAAERDVVLHRWPQYHRPAANPA